jgi:adenosylhomocysteine nucleosidase
MEAGGLALDFHTQTGDPKVNGWLVIRGISDNADATKNDTHHQLAAKNAAQVLFEQATIRTPSTPGCSAGSPQQL